MNKPHLIQILQFLKEQAESHGMSEWEECGCCGAYHPPNYGGDCRDDRYRIPTWNPFDYIIEEISILPDEEEAYERGYKQAEFDEATRVEL